jgi:cellobiose phosphorylase
MTRVYRGVTYRIAVKNPEKVSKGVKKILVNGQEIKGLVVPVQPKDAVVEVIMGKDGETDELSKIYWQG